jgi:hypothetical protein
MHHHPQHDRRQQAHSPAPPQAAQHQTQLPQLQTMQQGTRAAGWGFQQSWVCLAGHSSSDVGAVELGRGPALVRGP